MENKINKKSLIQKFWYLCLILIIFQFLMEVFWGLELLIYDVNTSFLMLLLVLMLLLLPIFFLDYNKNKIDKKTYLVFATIVAVFILLQYVFCFSSSKYFYFNSPYKDSNRVLVVEESSLWTSGDDYFYERKYMIFIKRINAHISYKTRPFSTGTANIKWLNENSVQVDYIYNTKGNYKTEIIKFDE